MFRPFLCLTIPTALILVAMPTQADWNPGDPFKMHFPQLPDLTPQGMDVLAGLSVEPTGLPPQLKVLADDFLCTQTGPITDIHIWGSWLNDLFPAPPDQGTFVLGIYNDIPADPTNQFHSRPGELLWQMQFKPGEYVAREFANAPEQFFDPNLNEVIGQDTVVWQYNFFIDGPLALHQEEGNIYWLAVANVDPNNDGILDTLDINDALQGFNRFGWKTSREHFNDDAVFLDLPDVFGLPVDALGLPGGAPFPGLPWRELIDPITGESLDLSFVITPEPATLALMTLAALAILRKR